MAELIVPVTAKEPTQQLTVEDTVPVTPVLPDDDITSIVESGRNDEQLAENLRKIEDLLTQMESDKPKEEEIDPNDPLDITFNKGREIGVAIRDDIIRGATEAPTAIVRGGIIAAEQLLHSIDDLAEWLNENVADLGGGKREEFGFRSLGELPKPDEAESVTGAGIEVISQFMLPFVGFLKGLKATFGAVTTVTGRIVQGQAAGGLALALAFDPMEKRLSNFIEENPTFSGPVTEFLQTDLDDSKALGRLKSGLEGLIIGAGAEVLI